MIRVEKRKDFIFTIFLESVVHANTALEESRRMTLSGPGLLAFNVDHWFASRKLSSVSSHGMGQTSMLHMKVESCSPNTKKAKLGCSYI